MPIPRILVIDDEEGMCWAVARALQEEGYFVRTATSGPAGLALLEQDGADLVLLDIRMPRMSGLEVLKRIKHAHPALPVIIMTGFGSMPTALEAIEKGAVGYITKPFNVADLKAAVKKTLASGSDWIEC
ncbi:MAG: response regulator [Bacillota bacterium]|jgi:DNA-binding NtrC family response regulator